jgi:hypothetical protein
MPGGGSLQDHGERLLVGDLVGHRPGQPRVGGDPLGVAAAGQQPDHPRAAARRGADELRARDQRQLLRRQVAVLGLVRISEVDPAGRDVEQLLAVRRDGVGQVDDVHDLGAAEAGDLHSTHVLRLWLCLQPTVRGMNEFGHRLPAPSRGQSSFDKLVMRPA